MRTLSVALAGALLAFSTQAHAGEGSDHHSSDHGDHHGDRHGGHSAEGARVELRGGVAWHGSHDYPAVALAFGYDIEAGERVVVGAELAFEKILTEGEYVEFEFSGRVGHLVGKNGQIFLVGGYTASEGENGPHAGFGYEHHIGHDGWYVSGEYHRLFGSHHKVNFALVGVGIKF